MSTTGGVGKERGYTGLIIALVIAFGFTGVDFAMLTLRGREDAQATGLTTQIQVLSQQTAKLALEAADGNVDSFKELETNRNTIDAAIQRLNKGDEKGGMKPYADSNATPAGRAVSALSNAWVSSTGTSARSFRTRRWWWIRRSAPPLWVANCPC